MSAVTAKVSAVDQDLSDHFFIGRKIVINRSNNIVIFPITETPNDFPLSWCPDSYSAEDMRNICC